jgi:cAMP-dependent protein kinase regulator
VEEAGKMVATSTEKQEDKEEEEEEEEDDELDEIPESMKKPEGQMSKMRTSVSAEAYGAWNQKKDFDPTKHQYPKTDEQKQRLKATLAKSFLFSSLEGKDMDTVILAMKEKVVSEKERLIQQGEDGDYLFVIEEGTIECLKKMEDGTEKCVKTCEPGDCFGELALLYNCPRAASVDSKAKCVLWQLDRETFNHIVKEAASKKRDRYDAFLATVPLLKQLESYERSQIADGLCRETYEDGAQVVVEDEPGDKFFIIESGEACAEKKGVGKVMDYQVGDYFGELSLLRNQPRAATVKAKGPLTVLSLPRGSFKRLLGPLDDILSRSAAKYEESSK